MMGRRPTRGGYHVRHGSNDDDCIARPQDRDHRPGVARRRDGGGDGDGADSDAPGSREQRNFGFHQFVAVPQDGGRMGTVRARLPGGAELVGSLILPAAGPIAVDSQIIIYGIEHHPIYAAFLQPLWLAIQAGTMTGAASELALMEVLVGPVRKGNGPL